MAYYERSEKALAKHKEIANRLEYLIKEQGYNINSFSNRINRPNTTLQHYFYGKRLFVYMTVEMAIEISEALGISIDYLYNGEEHEKLEIKKENKTVSQSAEEREISENNMVNEVIRIRQEQGVTQRELGIVTNIDAQTISNFERGRRSISFRRYLRIVNALGYKVKLEKEKRR